MVVVIIVSVVNDREAARRSMTPEELDQEARRLRALGHHADAQAEYNDKRAKAALKAEELREVEEFLKHQRAKHRRR